jgi:putative membrane protein
MISNLHLVFEIWVISAFLLLLIKEILQKNKINVFELIAASVFGLLLELGNTHLAHTYFYSPQFLIKIFDVPLAVGFGWAIIIYGSMSLTDQFNLPRSIKPFFDAFTALILDLSMDTIAIRLDFWNWSIPLNQEWYGVPFENLFGWIAVVLSFSYLARFIRTLNTKRPSTKLLQIFTPFIAYFLLVIQLSIYLILSIIPFQINYIADWSHLLNLYKHQDFSIIYQPEVQLWKSIILIIVVVEIINILTYYFFKSRKSFQKYFNFLSFLILTTFHLFFFITLIAAKIYLQAPFLVVISSLMLILHLILHFIPLFFQHQKKIYTLAKIPDFLVNASGKMNKARRKMDNLINTYLK